MNFKVSKTQAPDIIVNAYCIVNVNIIHHSEFSNRLMMPIPRLSKHAVYSQSVCNMITANKGWFLQWSSAISQNISMNQQVGVYK